MVIFFGEGFTNNQSALLTVADYHVLEKKPTQSRKVLDSLICQNTKISLVINLRGESKKGFLTKIHLDLFRSHLSNCFLTSKFQNIPANFTLNSNLHQSPTFFFKI